MNTDGFWIRCLACGHSARVVREIKRAMLEKADPHASKEKVLAVWPAFFSKEFPTRRERYLLLCKGVSALRCPMCDGRRVMLVDEFRASIKVP